MSRQEMESTPKSVGTVVGERRRMPRYHLLTRVDILLAGSADVYWGSVCNLSRSSVAVSMRQHLKAHQRVTVRFRLQSPDGRVIIVELAAMALWQCGDNTGLEFDPPLTAGSPALQKVRDLVAHPVAKQSGWSGDVASYGRG